MANHYEVGQIRIPLWLIQAIVGLIFTTFVAWATWQTRSAQALETRVTVTESRVSDVKDDIHEIKDTQKEILTELRTKRGK